MASCNTIRVAARVGTPLSQSRSQLLPHCHAWNQQVVGRQAASVAARDARSSQSAARQARPQVSTPAPDSVAQATRVSDDGIENFSENCRSDELMSVWWKRQRERRSRLKPDREHVERLSTDIEAIIANLVPHESHVAQKDEFLRRLQHTLKDTIDGAEVAPFGSVVNGFWTHDSDLDICMRIPGATTRPAQIQALRKIAQELSQYSSYHIEPRFGAQVPILHWAPQRPGMVACDISINNVLAVVNSRLVGHYVQVDSRLRTLGLCVKAWAKARGINDRSRGTVSSFALVLMLIHFLQRRDPPALPSLQDLAFSRNEKPMYVAGVDCRYCTDMDAIQQELKYLRGDRPPNQESVGQLLLEFLRYFGYDYKYGVIRIRDTRSFIPPIDESSAYLIVDNPYEVGKDVANIDETQHDVIRKEFRRAWSFLSQGRPFSELLKSSSLEEATARSKPLVWASGARQQW